MTFYMNKFILITLVFLLLFAIKLIVASKRIKQLHFQKMMQLKAVFKSLSRKQEILNQKASISNDFESNYKMEIKKVGEEIFVLQKRIFELLSKK